MLKNFEVIMPLITLTTDFGLHDPYVGMMKGVIYSIAPEVKIVDITHSIGFANIRQASFITFIAGKYFPGGTVHIIVVDPGVGSSRFPLAVKTPEAVYISPDNGCLSMILNDNTGYEARAISSEEFMLSELSNTFHGRDIFAPAGAHLTRGLKFEDIGPIVEPVILKNIEPIVKENRVSASAMHIDIFGNIITNLPADFEKKLVEKGSRIKIDGQPAEIVNTFSKLPSGKIGLLIGSAGFLEIVADKASAAEILGTKVGDYILIDLIY